jgi:hypothetical protein
MTEETEKRMVTSLSLDMMEREKERKKEKKKEGMTVPLLCCQNISKD